MRQLSSPVQAPWLLRRSLLLVLVAGAMTLLNACSIWPKSLNPWADPDPVQAQPAPAPTAAAETAPPAAPATAAPAPTFDAQSSAVASPVMPRAEVVSNPMAEPTKATAAAAPSTAMPADKPSAGAAAMQSKNPAVLVPGYYINVGLFAVPANGTKAYNKLEAAGLPVFSDPVKKKDVTVTRVRVGPFTTRAKADAAAKKIRSLKLEAAVFQHKG